MLYRYAPQRKTRRERVIAAALLLTACGIMLLSLTPIGVKSLNQLLAFLAATAGILVTTRYCLTDFIYEIDRDENGVLYMQVIRRQGKRLMTVAQFDLSQLIAFRDGARIGDLEKETGSLKRQMNCCVSMEPAHTLALCAESNGERFALLLECGEELAALLGNLQSKINHEEES